MLAASVPNYDRVLSLEDDFVAVRESPFTDDGDSATLPAVAVDWNPKQAAFNVTLLSISHDGSQERLWSDSFSISKIERRHFELCLVYPELQSLLPKLPKDPQGIWGYIQWTYVPHELCKKLEEYFKNAFNICGWKLLSSVFFGEPVYFDDDYTISTLELKRNQFVKVIEQILQEFQRHLVEKINASGADQLFEWYETLWNCMAKVTDAEIKLLAFDCEPYEELRDIAQRERTECATIFNQQSMTASTFQDNVQNFSQWEDQYIESVKKINEFRIAHFKISLPRLEQIFKLLQDDSDKFTDDDNRIFGCLLMELRVINIYNFVFAFFAAVSVLTKLYQLEKESLQNEIEMLNCANQLKLLERDKIRRDALALDEDLSMPEKLNEKEIEVYTKQCEILVLSCDIQDKNERIARLDLQKLASEVKSDELESLKGNLNQSLTTISRKKAILRNKKNVCEAEIKKLTRKEDEKEEQYVTHHAVQMKIEKRREQDGEKGDARLEERQKTLLRLKEYKKKYPKAKDVKPPRYQPPSVRKQETKVKNNSCSDTPTSAPISQPTLKKDEDKKQTPQSPKENGSFDNNNIPSSPSTVCPPAQAPGIPCAPPPPPPGAACPPPPPPPPLPPGIPPPPPSVLAIKSQKSQSSVSNKSPVGQGSSLSEQTLDLDALKVARSRLKKQDNTTPAANNNQKGFPSGNELTRAIQSVKLRRVVNEEKPAELSPDGAEFLKKALERMNKFTTLSFDDDEEDIEEQEW